jgi:hypothetical protein
MANTNTYQVLESEIGGTIIVVTRESGEVSSIPMDPANSDYQAYLAQLEKETN